MKKLNFNTLLLKITRKCNATCSHCSASKYSDHIIYDLNLLKKAIDKVAKYVYNKCNILFHGGEPMVIGIDYYNELLKYINSNYPDKFIFSMQSNFLLYNSEWQELIEKYKIGMSTSYDFFSDIRNLHGDVKKYYDIWYKNIKTFQENMSKFFNQDYYVYLINIINKQNYTKAKEIYEIAKKEKFNIRHNYFWKVGRGDKNSDKYYIEVDLYKKFILETLQYLIQDLKDGKEVKNIIFPIDYFKSKIAQPYSDKECPWINNCAGSSLLIDFNGDLYTCQTFSDIKKFSFGNINNINDLIEITNNKNFISLYNRRIKLPKECIQCKYLKYCQGGCMRDSYINEKNFQNLYGKTWACEAWYAIIDEIIKNRKLFNI